MLEGDSQRPRLGRVIIAAVAMCAGLVAARADEPAKPVAVDAAAARVAAVRAASDSYVRQFNERDLKALGDQWTADARLVEGRVELVGRDAIVRSIAAWLDRHPEARLKIDVRDAEPLAASVVRVSGEMTFIARPKAKPVTSRFVSLRVLEDGVWRLAESVVTPNQAAQLDALDWLVGTWRNDPGGRGDSVEATFSKPLGESCIVGRVTLKPWDGDAGAREALHVIHADRASGLVRAWVFDSSGARAEGVVESDGTSFHETLVGTPAETAPGSVARWVQVIAPTGADRCTLHAIERSLDGERLPDGEPVHLRKIH